MIEDADGSLLVIDTGGWFAGAGCPTSKISKPQHHGAIYRVRTTNSTRPADPWASQIDWLQITQDRLLQRLGEKTDLRPRSRGGNVG